MGANMASYLRTASEGSILRICFTEAKILDALLIQEIQDDLLPTIEKAKEPNILLDFRTVTFMSSAALGTVIRVHKRCKQTGKKLKLCCIAPDIREVFAITTLDRVLEIYDTAEQAEQAFGK